MLASFVLIAFPESPHLAVSLPILGALSPAAGCLQRAMEFLDTPEPGAAPAAYQPPHSAVRFAPGAVAATADSAEVGQADPETPLLGVTSRPSLADGKGFHLC
jgi:hypothetical protein